MTLLAVSMGFLRRLLLGSLLLLAGAGPVPVSGQEADLDSLLVFSKTNDYRHASIADGRAALRALADDHGWEMKVTEDSTAFRRDRLMSFDVVVFLNTSGNVLGPRGQDALRAFIEDGGGFVGVHAASDTEYDWPWYGRLVGACFDGHPEVQAATRARPIRTRSSASICWAAFSGPRAKNRPLPLTDLSFPRPHCSRSDPSPTHEPTSVSQYLRLDHRCLLHRDRPLRLYVRRLRGECR